MTRRQLLSLAACTPLVRAASAADHTLTISEISAEIGKGRTVRTLAYNGQVPGPLLRMKQGRMTAVEVINETRMPEMVHWHGFHIPPEVDGAHEEGTPMVQSRSRRTYEFIPTPAGTRWYHTHAMAGHDLKIGSYSGQFGMVIVEPASDPARYDVEVPLLLHEFDPYFQTSDAMDLSYRLFTVNGRMLGSGEPVRVRSGQRLLLRILNASATLDHKLALAGHTFQVVALDGNPVASPRSVPVIHLGPGERADAIVECGNPGVWIFGELDAAQRTAGAGIVFEYAGARSKPLWNNPPAFEWQYADFARSEASPAAAHRIPIVIEPGKNGNLWAINGRSWPDTPEIPLIAGVRNRLVFDNRGHMDHPVHLHRHTMELATVDGKPMSGLFKDVIWVPAHKVVEADIAQVSAGPSLFHCHQQFHMDFGFMALMRGSAAR
ncbi:MAG: multicopper oxidase domain-containing protein [Candidatus Solibacter sp.]